MCEVPEDRALTANEQTDLVLAVCDCAMGLSFRAKKQLIQEAKDNIDMLCFEGAQDSSMTPIENEDVREVLYKAVELIAKGTIFDLTMKVSAGGTVKVSAGSKGTIKVKRTVGFSEQLEANQKY
jgi:hypothetical protein